MVVPHRRWGVRPPQLALVAALLELARAAPAAAFQEPGNERVEDTAYTLRAREWSLGVLAAQYGIIDELTVGTYVPTWLAWPVLGVFAPTAFVKARDPLHWERLAASLRVGVAYFDARELSTELREQEGSSVDLVIVPIEPAVSVRYTDWFDHSLELTYVLVGAGVDIPGDTEIVGAGTATSLTLSTLLEFRVSRVTALTLLGRALLARGNASFSLEAEDDETTVDADLGARQRTDGFTWCLVPGVELSWEHVNLDLGLGYGSLWLPVVELPTRGRGVVPYANIYARF